MVFEYEARKLASAVKISLRFTLVAMLLSILFPTVLAAQAASSFQQILINNGSGKVLDVYGNGTASGTRVDIATPNGTTAQLWEVIPLSDGNIQLMAGNGSGMVLDVYADGKANGTKVDIATPNGTSAQEWKIESSSNGIYRIMSENGSSLVLDVYGDGTANGTPVDIAQQNGTGAQNWETPIPTYDYSVNGATVKCTSVASAQCSDAAVGTAWQLAMNITALCNNGNSVAAAISMYASCSVVALGDVAGWDMSYPASVLTSSGWIVRWVGGVGATGNAVAGVATWTGYEENYCDTTTNSFIPADSPC